MDFRNFGDYIKMYVTIRGKKDQCNYQPIQVHIEPTNSCNLNCPMCPVNEIKPKGNMTMELLENLAKQDSYHTVALYLFGESLLHPQFDLMIKALRQNNKRVFIHTNGTLLNKENSRKILESGINALSISLHTPKSLPIILDFLKYRKEIGNRTPIYVESLDIREERLGGEDIQNIKKLGARYSIKKVHNWRGLYETKHQRRKYYGCYHPFWMMGVCWDGTVVACCRDERRKFVIGDANTQRLAEIWNGPKMRQFRRNLHNNVKFEPCANCDKLYQPQFTLGKIVKELLDKRKK